MEQLGPFVDIEDVALAMFASVAPTVLATPADIVPPLIEVRKIGGSNTRFDDSPKVLVNCFGSDHRSAADMAESCRQIVIASPATAAGATSIDDARTEIAPVFEPYGDSSAHRYVATYQFVLRRPR